jgi:hypothetical protein
MLTRSMTAFSDDARRQFFEIKPIDAGLCWYRAGTTADVGRAVEASRAKEQLGVLAHLSASTGCAY